MRTAIYRHFPQAIPSAYAVDKMGDQPLQKRLSGWHQRAGLRCPHRPGPLRRRPCDLIRQDNPLPAVCGRVCTHPCEAACGRGEVDEPVAIRELKRFVADWESHQPGAQMDLPEPAEPRPEKVAIVGSGPAGLTSAYYLALRGYQVTIFEALPVAGGMLRVGIPGLPPAPAGHPGLRDRFHQEACGVDIKLNTPLGPEFGLDDIKEQGLSRPYSPGGGRAQGHLHPGVSGEAPARGGLSGVDFLRQAALGQAECPGKRVGGHRRGQRGRGCGPHRASFGQRGGDRSSTAARSRRNAGLRRGRSRRPSRRG